MMDDESPVGVDSPEYMRAMRQMAEASRRAALSAEQAAEKMRAVSASAWTRSVASNSGNHVTLSGGHGSGGAINSNTMFPGPTPPYTTTASPPPTYHVPPTFQWAPSGPPPVVEEVRPGMYLVAGREISALSLIALVEEFFRRQDKIANRPAFATPEEAQEWLDSLTSDR